MIGTYQLLGNIANLVQAAAYTVKDVFWLRILLVVGGGIEIIYSFHIAEQPLWINIFWTSIYVGINSIQVVLLLLEQNQTNWTEEEKLLYATIFRYLSQVNFKKLMRAAQWQTFSNDEVLAVEGEALTQLTLIYEGLASVSVQEKTVVQLHNNSFVGEMSFLTGGQASATVKTIEPSRCLVWEQEDLKELMLGNTDLQAEMQTVFSSDLITKLLQRNQEIANQPQSLGRF